MIRQNQETDEQLERNRERLIKMTAKFDGEIGELESKVTEQNRKIEKTLRERLNLEEKKSDSSKQMISEGTYKLISDKVSKIVSIMAPNMAKNAEKQTVDLLFELEQQIDKFVTYYQIVQKVEKKREGMDSDDDMEDAQNKAKLKAMPSRKILKEIKDAAKA